MSPIRLWRPLATGLAYHSRPTIPIHRILGCGIRVKSFAIKRLRTERNGRRDYKPRRQEEVAPPPADSPEIRLVKDRLIRAVSVGRHNRMNLEDIDHICADYLFLVDQTTVLQARLIKDLLVALCKIWRVVRSRLVTGHPAFDQEALQRMLARLTTTIDHIVAQYKHGRFETDGHIPATVLFHYNDAREFDKALQLWDWLCRMRAPGHLIWKSYAARIAIARHLKEGGDRCEQLYQEALAKLGNSFINYHLSNNAVLAKTSQPVTREVYDAAELTKSMFLSKIEHADWRGAYLALDTLLRIRPNRLWNSVAFQTNGFQSAWEAFLVQCIEAIAGSKQELKDTEAWHWLRTLFQNYRTQDKIDTAMARVHSIACTLLASSMSRHYVKKNFDEDKRVLSDHWNYGDILLLWSCWMQLYRWHGRDDPNTSPQNGAAVMAEFIFKSTEHIDSKSRSVTVRNIKRNLKLIPKFDGVPELKEQAGHMLADLRERIRRITSDDNQQDLGTLSDIPGWGCPLSQQDMYDLYQELVLNGSGSPSNTIVDSGDSNEKHLKNLDIANSGRYDQTAGLVYETSTGIPFSRARFLHWATINNMFIVADAFERNGCLHWQTQEIDDVHGPSETDPADVVSTETAVKQAEVLETLNSPNMSEEDKKLQKEILLNRLREFRRYRGESSLGI